MKRIVIALLGALAFAVPAGAPDAPLATPQEGTAIANGRWYRSAGGPRSDGVDHPVWRAYFQTPCNGLRRSYRLHAPYAGRSKVVRISFDNGTEITAKRGGTLLETVAGLDSEIKENRYMEISDDGPGGPRTYRFSLRGSSAVLQEDACTEEERVAKREAERVASAAAAERAAAERAERERAERERAAAERAAAIQRTAERCGYLLGEIERIRGRWWFVRLWRDLFRTRSALEEIQLVEYQKAYGALCLVPAEW